MGWHNRVGAGRYSYGRVKMNTSGSQPGENLDSAAKLMLEALSKASDELDKTVNILTEQLLGFNQSLEKSFKDELDASRERMESALRQNLDGLLRDREAVMKAIAEFKRAEIEKVILSGKTVRSGLAAQVEDATRALSGTVAGKIVGIKEHLSQPEAEIKRRHDILNQALIAAVTQAQQDLNKARMTEEHSIQASDSEFESKFMHLLNEGHREFEARFSQRRDELGTHGEQVVSELAGKYDQVITRLETSYQEGINVVSKNSQESVDKLKQLSEGAGQHFSQQCQSFSASLASLSELLNGLYEMRLNNLAAQSRTEIVSAAQHADECLLATKAELQVCLKEFQRDYVAQFEGLHTRFEKSLDEFGRTRDSSAMRGLKEQRAREQLHSLFRRLGQEMIDSAAAAANRLEHEFQRSMDMFAQRIEMAKSQACESLERESKLMAKELTRSFQDFEKQLLELQAQAAQIEKHGRDAANIVMTIRQANLNL